MRGIFWLRLPGQFLQRPWLWKGLQYHHCLLSVIWAKETSLSMFIYFTQKSTYKKNQRKLGHWYQNLSIIHITGGNFFETPRHFKFEAKTHYKLDHKLQCSKLCKAKDAKTQNENLSVVQLLDYILQKSVKFMYYPFKKHLLILFLLYATCREKKPCIWTAMPMK